MPRPICPICLRAQSACICRWITPTPHSAQVLILQHPLETDHAKGSAKLLHLSLAHSHMVVGEAFAADDLNQLLYEPWAADGMACEQAVLLYPEATGPAALHSVGNAQTHTPANERSTYDGIAPTSRLRLVVIDGTWRKSRKILHLNPLLQQLPRLSLHNTAASRYTIRKAHQPDQLSTLEATCAALAQIEGCAEPFAPLLRAFDGFIAQQSAYLQL